MSLKNSAGYTQVWKRDQVKTWRNLNRAREQENLYKGRPSKPISEKGCIRYTVEPLIKATPEMRPPLYKGHFARPLMCILIQINP